MGGVSVPSPGAAAAPLRLLIDSNFYITLEPYGGEVEVGQASAAEVVRLGTEQGHTFVVHPATRDDLLQAGDQRRRAQRLAELAKYQLLEEGPVPALLTLVLGTPNSGSNDERDLRILAALHHNAAAYLITNDRALRRRALRIGLGERVLTVGDAVDMLRQLAPAVSTPPPRIRPVAPYALDAEQGIFLSLRADYPEFDRWLDHTVRPDVANRDCLVVEDDGAYAALAIVKRLEEDCRHPFPQPVCKLATLKVNEDYLGSKYGELLLKSVFAAARQRRTASMYVEVLPKHDGLIDLLARFGFADSGARTPRDELIMVKHLRPPEGSGPLSALEHHVSYGPPAIAGTGAVFLVPIRPHWHGQLFPDAPDQRRTYEQLSLIAVPQTPTHPWGNALRKAYLSNSASNRLQPGDTLLFYRSRGLSSVTAIGVVEETRRSSDPGEVLAFVAGRTVYTPEEVAAMCRSVRGVLAVLFRQDRFIDPPWTLPELQANGVLTSWPQSITKVRERGAQWVNEQLAG